MKKEIYFCDICKLENNDIKKIKGITVIFTTEQTEGRATEPYLYKLNNIDICPSCIAKIIEGRMIFASGAQGYNEYTIKSAGEKNENYSN